MPKRYKSCNCADTKVSGADTFTESLFSMQHLAVFTKNCGRLIEHDAVIEFFKPVLEMASQQDLLLGENTSA